MSLAMASWGKGEENMKIGDKMKKIKSRWYT